jgi:hypothetical protein
MGTVDQNAEYNSEPKNEEEYNQRTRMRGTVMKRPLSSDSAIKQP